MRVIQKVFMNNRVLSKERVFKDVDICSSTLPKHYIIDTISHHNALNVSF